MNSLLVSGIILCILAEIADAGVQLLPNQFCKPRPTVVATDHPNYAHFPFFVTLHRCAGSWNTLSPSHWKCVANKSENIDISVLNLATLSPSSPMATTLKVENHTSCTLECATKESDCKFWERYDPQACSCKCPYDKAPISCGPRKYWNRYTCNCECTETSNECPAKRSWSKDTCGCICDATRAARCAELNKVLDSRTCSCKDNIRISSAEKGKGSGFGKQSFWYYVVIGEFAVLMLLFDTVLFFKKSGMIYALTKSCRAKEVEISSPGVKDKSAFHNYCVCRTANNSLLSLDQQGGVTSHLNTRRSSTECRTEYEYRSRGESGVQCV